MSTIQQTVQISDDRQLHLDIPVPDNIPVGTAQVDIVISPLPAGKTCGSLLRFAGIFADSDTFAGDPVEVQRAMRDDW